MNKFPGRSGHFFLVLLFIASTTLIISGCSGKRSTVKARKYYSENYPEGTLMTSDESQSPKKERRREEPKSTKKKELVRESQKIDYSKPQPMKAEIVRKEKPVYGYLDDPVEMQYADEERILEEQNTVTFVEEKLFKMIQKAYEQRDQKEFLKLYSLFLESFPGTSRQSYLEEYRQSFFYKEGLDVDRLEGSMTELLFPEAKTWDELNQYFAKLNRNGIATIQLNMVQLSGETHFLFAKRERAEGYYFHSNVGRTIDDVLEKATQLAHDNNLKVFISFPLRNHPMISQRSEYLLDESWNPIQNKTAPNAKLDLLNPGSKNYLLDLLDSIMASSADGIIFQDDFTYKIHEGFSSMAQKRFRFHTGREVEFNNLFVPVQSGHRNAYGILATNDFNAIVDWRSGEIKQLLWELIDYVRQQKPGTSIGLETTPEMLLRPKMAKKWYSTGLHYLHDLNVNFFVLKRRKFDSEAESAPKDFIQAAKLLRETLPRDKNVVLKVPLNKKTNNVIEMNRGLHGYDRLLEDYEGFQLAIGPVDRTRNFTFLKYTISTQDQKER